MHQTEMLVGRWPVKPCAPDALLVASAADEAYAVPLAVCLYSAAKNYRGVQPLHLLILDAGISDASRRRISEVLAPLSCRVDWILVPDRAFEGTPVRSHISRAAYARLALPELVAPEVQKVLYLDSDTVVEGDLAELFATDVADHALAAVQDPICPVVSSPHGIKEYRSLGLSPDAPYFNSGVLLINVRHWREHAIPQRALRYLDAHRAQLRCLDQEGLNAVLGGQWLRLDRRWNQLVAPGSGLPWHIRPARKKGVLHFVSNRKPWLANGWHPLYVVYDRYQSAIGWERGWARSRSAVALWAGRAYHSATTVPYRSLRRRLAALRTWFLGPSERAEASRWTTQEPRPGREPLR